jgi:hypothetical protein
LFVWKNFFKIPAQKFFGPVQRRITRTIARHVSTNYAVLLGQRMANSGCAHEDPHACTWRI